MYKGAFSIPFCLFLVLVRLRSRAPSRDAKGCLVGATAAIVCTSETSNRVQGFNEQIVRSNWLGGGEVEYELKDVNKVL